MRGHNDTVVPLDPGGFWNNRQQKIFNASITASVALVRCIQPALPFLIRHPAGRAALLAQFSAPAVETGPRPRSDRTLRLQYIAEPGRSGESLGPRPQAARRPAVRSRGSLSLDGAGRTRSRCPTRQKSSRHCTRTPRCTGSKTAGISRIGTSLWRQQGSSSSRRSRQVVNQQRTCLWLRSEGTFALLSGVGLRFDGISHGGPVCARAWRRSRSTAKRASG
jgi:hypothetical protein